MSIATNIMHEFTSNLKSTNCSVQAKSAALDVVATTPMPTTRMEAWKYTRVAKIGKIAFTTGDASLASADEFLIQREGNAFVFVNGQFNETLSSVELPVGASWKLLSECDTIENKVPIDGEIFNATNTAYLNDGVEITIDDKAQLAAPIQIIHVLTGAEVMSNFRTVIHAGKFSKSAIVQGFFSANSTSSFCNSITEVTVADNAHLTMDKVQSEAASNFHISTEYVDQERDTTFTLNTITLNGGLVRNNVWISVNGENCVTNLNGGYLLKEHQHVDNHTVVDHKVPNCESHELYKGVMDDKSTAVFNGKVYVRPDAQKINAFQSNGNVLLSDDASVNSKPELEIYADDVKCSHGSTTGQIDEEAVFYLRARGISEKAARQLMISAFIGDVFEKIENETVLEFVNAKLTDRFGW